MFTANTRQKVGREPIVYFICCHTGTIRLMIYALISIYLRLWKTEIQRSWFKYRANKNKKYSSCQTYGHNVHQNWVVKKSDKKLSKNNGHASPCHQHLPYRRILTEMVMESISGNWEKICNCLFELATVRRQIWGNYHLSCGFGLRRSHLALGQFDWRNRGEQV